jgi:molecular chaperone HtpG
VTVRSSSGTGPEHVWESEAGGSFTVTESKSETPLVRGTELTLHLKEDMGEYLEYSKIKELVKRHSEFIEFPIYLLEEKKEMVEEPVSEEEDDENGEDDKPKVEEVDEDEAKEDKPKTKQVEKVTMEDTHLNGQSPVWTRPIDEVTEDEHKAFYKAISNDWEEYATVKHFKVEGQLEFKGLLYAPKKAPFDMFGGHEKKNFNKIKLYVRKVFIMDNCPDLLPEWLNFIQGVVDSEDLPLNISREILQHNKILKVVKKTLVKRCLEMFDELAEKDSDAYDKFYEAFGKNLKLGVHEDSNNRTKIAKLLRFHTSASDEMTSLADYVGRMKENQPGIYFISGESLTAVKGSPFLERIKARGYEVIYMVDPIDEYAVQQLTEFEEKKFMCASKEDLDLGETEEEKKAQEETKAKLEKLCTAMKETLGDKVEKVISSNRLSDSPCCLVTGSYGWTANMERIMKAQALGDSNKGMYMSSKKTLEINAGHRIVLALLNKFEKDETDKTVKDLVWLLYDTSLLTSGFTLDDPTVFGKRIHRLIDLGLGFDDEDEADNDEMPELEDIDENDESTMEQVD